MKTHDREFGYNLLGTGEKGVITHSEESKQKIKIARAKQISTPETKRKQSEAIKGTKRTKEEYWKTYNTKREKGLIKSVIQMDKKGNFIKEWESNAIASNALNIHRSCISAACRNKRNVTKAGGFKWKFKD